MKPVKAPVLYEELTYKIIGCAMRVHKELGPIHKEVIYQKSLEKALIKDGLKVDREVRLPVKFDGETVGTYIPDFVVNDLVLLELKALEFLPKGAEIQLSYYLKATGYKIGLIFNFGSPSLQIKRRIYG
jgi:GxxExxY protein